MWKRAIRWSRPALVWAVIILFSLESALACRWRSRRSVGSYRPAPTCGDEVSPSDASQSPIQKGGEASPGFSGTIDAVPTQPLTPAEPPKPEPDPSEPPPPAPTEPAPPKPEPPKPEPVHEPADPAPPKPPAAAAPGPKPDNFDDLFPPPTPKPAEVPADPAAAPADPTATPAEPPKPADPPKPAAPAPSPNEDDPFAPAPATPKPAVPAPAPAQPVEDDPFAPPPATAPPAPKPPAAGAAPAADADPFAPPAPKPAAAPKPDEAPKAAVEDDDPFKISAEGSLPVREWVDDTGSFRVRGRLIAVLDGKIRILKETGRTTTVPLARLSAADRTYVDEAVSRYGDRLDANLAAR